MTLKVLKKDAKQLVERVSKNLKLVPYINDILLI